MPFYALAIRPLIDALRLSNNSIRQTWYADDATAAGSISALKEWWQELCKLGPAYGYFVNASKTWLVTKKEHLSLANNIFKDLNVNITTEGRPMLGAAIGKDSYIKSFVSEKVDGWVSEIE